MTDKTRENSKYRIDLDGLRAVAIALVVVFHAFPARLGGGFIGVDIFLVLSGYLITSSLLQVSPSVSGGISQFYLRRAKRILPSLLTVLIACMILGWGLLLPGEYEQLGKHVAGGASFLSNIVLYGEAGYFDAASETKPLLHLWYLGVDIQFCLIWPIALLLMRRCGMSMSLGLLLLMAMSFAFNLYQVAHDPSGAYFLPFSRAWELMLGGFLAVRPQAAFGERHGALGRETAALVGTVLIAIAALTLDRSRPYPGWWALIPTLGTACLILAGPQAWINRRILAHPILIGLGLISFPLYLWHWPLLTVLRLQTESTPSAVLVWITVAVSMLLAWATWRGIERPLLGRWRGAIANRAIAGGLGFTILAGLFVYNNAGLPHRMPLIASFDAAYADQNYSNAHDLFRHDRQECNFYDGRRNTGKSAIDPSCYTSSSGKVVFVWGDSHSQHLQYGLKNALPPDVTLLQVAASGCIPSLKPLDDDPVGACNRANAFAIEKIKELKPSIVLLAQEGHHEENDYPALIAQLHQMGAGKVMLLGPVPHWKPHLYKIVERKYHGTPPQRTWKNIQEDALATDRVLKQNISGLENVVFISLIDKLCNVDGCPIYLGDEALNGLTSYDYGHFTLPMSDYVGRTILAPEILKILR